MNWVKKIFESDVRDDKSTDDAMISPVARVCSWAEKETKKLSRAAKADDPSSLLNALSVSLIYSFTTPGIGKPKATDIAKSFHKAQLKYSGDSSLFELGCYAYFRIDAWHVEKGLDIFRKEILYSFLIPKFIQVFQCFLNTKNLHTVINNRLELYGHLAKTEPDRIPFFFTQLLLRSTDNNEPSVYNFESSSFPTLIADTVETISIRIVLDSFNETMLPLCIESISTIYEMLISNERL